MARLFDELNILSKNRAIPYEQYIGEMVLSKEQEEERRLMYVAVTRAKKNLYITWAKQRRIYGIHGRSMAIVCHCTHI